jgi:hypothetical protein
MSEYLAGFGKVASEIEAGAMFGETPADLMARLNALSLRHQRNVKVSPLRPETKLRRVEFAEGFVDGIAAMFGI